MDKRRTLSLTIRGLAVAAAIAAIGLFGLTRVTPSHANVPGPY